MLVELFTSAECGPCVPTDHAFEALGRAYGPAEVVAVQYHLHVPRPNPLANPAALERQRYYGIESAPTPRFNGQEFAGGGGSKGDALRKFNQYRGVVGELLRGQKAATIDLTVRRDGDDVPVPVTAAAASRGDAPGDARLRLVLVEREVRYAGSNGVESHRNVARAMPGGAAGTGLVGGRLRAEEVIRLGDVRAAQEAYLRDYPDSPGARGSFGNSAPPIAFDNLAVVAFLQAADKRVLHAVLVPVPRAGTGGRP